MSRRGSVDAEAHYSQRVYPGLVWMSLHFADQKVNWLTHDVGDPLIGTPEYKVSAVRVEALGACLSSAEPRLDVESCESTQLLVDTSLAEGALVVADHQTAGRGRLGRSWEAPAGTALLCSLLLKPPPERPMPELSLVAGIAVADALERMLGLAVQIKWPNDVMLRRRKIAGCLAEARDGAVVLGIGVNVDQIRATSCPDNAGSIRTLTGRTADREVLLSTLLEDLA